MILEPSVIVSKERRSLVFLGGALVLMLSVLSVLDGWHLEAADAARNGYYGSSYLRFKEAAEDGNAEAQNNIANLYYLGLGPARNIAQAAHWYQRAAFNGNSDAQINLGLMHANGLGVSLDLERAYGWFRFAHRNGNDRAKIWVDYMAERYSMAPNMTKDIEFKFRELQDFR